MKKNIITALILTALMLVGCNNVQPTTSSSGDNSTSTNQNVTENAVKIRSIDVEDNNTQTQSLKRKKNANNVENVNYIIIYKTQTDITFTITLDNPEAYAIDAIRVACDDPDSQIMVDGEYKAINMESDGTRVINWASEDPYTKTYNIRTTSQEAINTFEVVDVRLAGHDKFQSKETNSTDLGNNELQIYKMDEDAITLNVIENTMEYIKFDFNIKEGYEDIISDINVVGLEKVENKEEEYWIVNEGKEYEIEYLYHTEFGDVKRVWKEWVGTISLNRNNELYPLNEFTADIGLGVNGESDCWFHGIDNDWAYEYLGDLEKIPDNCKLVMIPVGFLGCELYENIDITFMEWIPGYEGEIELIIVEITSSHIIVAFDEDDYNYEFILDSGTRGRKIERYNTITGEFIEAYFVDERFLNCFRIKMFNKEFTFNTELIEDETREETLTNGDKYHPAYAKVIGLEEVVNG